MGADPGGHKEACSAAGLVGFNLSVHTSATSELAGSGRVAHTFLASAFVDASQMLSQAFNNRLSHPRFHARPKLQGDHLPC